MDFTLATEGGSGEYRMEDNFRRVLIFIIFMIDLAITKTFTHET